MSAYTLEPGAIRRDTPNLFKEAWLTFPRFGDVMGLPAGGTTVFIRDGVICIGQFVPKENNPEGCSIAFISGLDAEQAHNIGVQLIDAAKEIGGDRGLQ